MATESCMSSRALDLRLVPCASGKRRRVDDSENDVVNSSSPINKIGDDVLAEVLIRVPEPEAAWRCKAVCKRWNSLISDPHFVRRFISHHQSGGEFEEEPPLMAQDSEESILSFLPLPNGLYGSERYHFRVYDSFKDLVLCGFHEAGECSAEFPRSLLLCNPFTKQWIALPLAPETSPSSVIGLKEAGLVCCTSNVNFDLGEGRPPFVYCSAYRFRVVCIYQLSNMSVRIDVFCSESGEWTKEALVLDQHGRRAYVNVVSISCNGGGLFWLCMRSQVLGLNSDVIAGFNPFRLDMAPIKFDVSGFSDGKWNISASQGAFHLVKLEPTSSLSVWRLEEDHKSWSIQHKTTFLGRTLGRCEYELKDCNVVGLHPAKPHIVFFNYLGVGGHLDSVILSHDMKTGELGLFGEFLPRFQPRVSCWPTPIPRYEQLRGMYDGSYSCWVQQSSSSSSKATALSLK